MTEICVTEIRFDKMVGEIRPFICLVSPFTEGVTAGTTLGEVSQRGNIKTFQPTRGAVARGTGLRMRDTTYLVSSVLSERSPTRRSSKDLLVVRTGIPL